MSRKKGGILNEKTHGDAAADIPGVVSGSLW